MSRHSRGKSVDESLGSSSKSNSQALNSLVFSIPNPCLYEETQFKSEYDKLIWVSSVNRSDHKIPVLYLKWKPKPKVDDLNESEEDKNKEDSHFTILFSQATVEDIGHNLEFLQILRDTSHCDIIVYEYTGFGIHVCQNSEQQTSNDYVATEKNCYDDVLSVFIHIVEELSIPPSKLILLGKGYGSAMTLHLASMLKYEEELTPTTKTGRIRSWGKRLSKGIFSENSLPYSGVAGVVLFSPVGSLLRHYRGTNPTIGGFFNDSFDSVAKSPKVKAPTLIVHPVDDEVISISHSKAIVEKLPNVWKFVESQRMEAEDDFLESFIDFLKFLGGENTINSIEFKPPENSGYISPELVLTEWLKEISMETYATIFIQNGYFDFIIIDSLQDEELEGMGISNPVHRSQILNHIQSRKSPKEENPKDEIPTSLRALSDLTFVNHQSPIEQVLVYHSKSEDVPSSPNSEFSKKSKGKKEKQEKISRQGSDETGVPHQFLKTQFHYPVWCFVCEFIFGLVYRGYLCKACNKPIHKKCLSKGLELQNCGSKSTKSPKAKKMSGTLGKTFGFLNITKL